MLVAFAEALRSFSSRLNALGNQTEPIPDLRLAPDTSLVPLLKEMRAQLDYHAQLAENLKSPNHRCSLAAPFIYLFPLRRLVNRFINSAAVAIGAAGSNQPE